MTEHKYRIIFSGKIIDGMEPRKVLDNLARLFKKSPQEVKQVFKRGAVINSGLPADRVEKALTVLRNAGIECIAEPVNKLPTTPAGQASNVTAPGGEDSPAPLPTEAVEGSEEKAAGSGEMSKTSGVRILEPEKESAELTLSPVNCNRIRGRDGGLVTTRMDRTFIALEDVIATAVFKLQEQPDQYFLLLYSRGYKRPLIVDATQISFSDFDQVPGATLQGSLRNFVCFLANNSKEFMIDRATRDFLDGDKPQTFEKDSLLLACGLYKAITQATGALDVTPPTPPPIESTVVAQTPQTASAVLPSKKTFEEPEQPMPAVKMILPSEQVSEWSRIWLMLACGLSLLGFVMPLLKRSIILDQFFFVWPWNLMGVGVDGAKAASMATFSQGEWLWLFALLPLITTAGTGVSAFMSPGRWQAPLLLVCGGGPLIASLVPLHAEAEIFGIIHLPMSWEGGAMLFVVIFAVALVAAANHTYKLSAPFLLLRLSYGLGGLLLLLATCLAFVAPPWNNWALYLLYLLLLMVAGIALKGTFKGPPGDDLTGWVGLLLRAVLVWTPIAAIISQSSYSDPFVTFVVESGGGVLPTVIASLKCYASYYAMAIAIAVGLAGLLAQRADRISSPDIKE